MTMRNRRKLVQSTNKRLGVAPNKDLSPSKLRSLSKKASQPVQDVDTPDKANDPDDSKLTEPDIELDIDDLEDLNVREDLNDDDDLESETTLTTDLKVTKKDEKKSKRKTTKKKAKKPSSAKE